jgi:aminoacyl tRNA synthase complex-interacting multifunctional protein 1
MFITVHLSVQLNYLSFTYRFDGKPEDVLNPKKKQLDKITPDLHTDGNGIATYRGVPFTTSAGPCRSSVPNASIK